MVVAIDVGARTPPPQKKKNPFLITWFCTAAALISGLGFLLCGMQKVSKAAVWKCHTGWSLVTREIQRLQSGWSCFQKHPKDTEFSYFPFFHGRISPGKGTPSPNWISATRAASEICILDPLFWKPCSRNARPFREHFTSRCAVQMGIFSFENLCQHPISTYWRKTWQAWRVWQDAANCKPKPKLREKCWKCCKNKANKTRHWSAFHRVGGKRHSHWWKPLQCTDQPQICVFACTTFKTLSCTSVNACHAQ